MYAITHAFSRRNAGDGLLVDLTLHYLERAGISREDCVVLALDPASFSADVRVESVPGEPWGRPSFAAVRASAHLALNTVSAAWRRAPRLTRVSRILARADGIIATGGGYLRTGGCVSSLGVLLNHLPQLALTAASRAPTVYLPQSIGPLDGPVGALVFGQLKRIDFVCVRDDRSLRELAPVVQASRVPDLAVLHLAETFRPDEIRSQLSGSPVVVARRLPRPDAYEIKLRQLVARLRDPRIGVQADGAGGRSDGKFYSELGLPAGKPLRDVLAQGEPGVVIAGRLHGAIQALLAGWPAIHLGYERKSWGAFSDLGLDEFVHDARRMDPEVILLQMETIRRQPRRYWEPLLARLHELRQTATWLTGQLHERLEIDARHHQPD